MAGSGTTGQGLASNGDQLFHDGVHLLLYLDIRRLPGLVCCRDCNSTGDARPATRDILALDLRRRQRSPFSIEALLVQCRPKRLSHAPRNPCPHDLFEWKMADLDSPPEGVEITVSMLVQELGSQRSRVEDVALRVRAHEAFVMIPSGVELGHEERP